MTQISWNAFSIGFSIRSQPVSNSEPFFKTFVSGCEFYTAYNDLVCMVKEMVGRVFWYSEGFTGLQKDFFVFYHYTKNTFDRSKSFVELTMYMKTVSATR